MVLLLHVSASCNIVHTAEGAAIDSLLRFMRGCNRSQPHVDLLKHAVAILAHTARYQALHSSLLASPECVQTLAEQLQMFRDKEVCQACSEDFVGSDVLLVVSQQQVLFA